MRVLKQLLQLHKTKQGQSNPSEPKETTKLDPPEKAQRVAIEVSEAAICDRKELMATLDKNGNPHSENSNPN